MKLTNEGKAEILVQALPYIQKYYDQIVVVKYGGNAMIDENLKKTVMRDLVLLAQIGVKVVLVHGGGPEITETLARMNIKSKFVDGLRVTDREQIDVVQMVLAGKVNKDLVALIGSAGGKAVGLCGIDGGMIEARPVSKALGYVGEVVSVDTKPVLDALKAGYIPVISSLGFDKEGNVYNINADTAASRIAGELKASSFINMTDIKGILENPADENSLIREVNASEALELIRDGVISGGMIPKVKCCVEAIRRGVKKVFIIDGRVPHAILIEVLSDEGIGTMFY
ncbi:MAG: acetylglutamate kinase [Firmicutes bacterium]|uniref:Acetylglutamate kinase n=1 Tax=Candidatus Stercoripulliclostridium pullicola TaxID=2840953 RepID=A0A940DHJ4_9FIRM|nr:acetylglutamate kinase [Candidatus Stercoripulliclostridium pullicola]